MNKDYLAKPSPLFLFPSMALQIGRGSGTSMHNHTAAQVVVALSGKLQVRMSPQASFSYCDAVLIPPKVNHRIIGSGSLEVMIWFDPATIEARTIRLCTGSKLMPLSEGKIDIFQTQLSLLSSHLKTCEEAIELSKIITQTLLPKYKSIKPIDERIVSVLKAFQNSSLLSQPYPLKHLANKVNLSEGRLRHLFRQELGVTIQQYWIGYRLLAAIRRFNSYMSLTEIAYETGFADLAHFSHAFRASFGMTPSLAVKDSRYVQVMFCQD